MYVYWNSIGGDGIDWAVHVGIHLSFQEHSFGFEGRRVDRCQPAGRAIPSESGRTGRIGERSRLDSLSYPGGGAVAAVPPVDPAGGRAVLGGGAGYGDLAERSTELAQRDREDDLVPI